MIFCVDMDNVLLPHQERIVEIYNDKYGTNYTVNDFTEYDAASTLGIDGAEKMRQIYSDPNVYDSLVPLKGAKNVMQRLVNAGHQVYIVTDAIPCTWERKVNWIKQYFPFIGEGYIISMKHKWLFRCDVMIEDRLETLLKGHHYERICIDASWNRDVRDEVYGIYRCRNWDDVSVAVDKIGGV